MPDDQQKEYKRGYNAGTSHVSSVRKYYEKRIELLERKIERLERAIELKSE